MKWKNNIKLEYSKIEEAEIYDKGFFETSEGARYENLPEFLRVRVSSKPGKNSLIYTEVWLPEEWNGIFVGLGNGGMAGAISYGELSCYVKEGYAVANTDMGTSRGRENGISNEDVWMDFGGRATHVMTVLAKKVIFAHYGKNPEYSYFTGVSTGGQQACTMAQRYPDDYDGIIAGVPANNRTMLHTYFLWNFVHLVPKGKSGLFSEEQIEFISECAARFFNGRGDGEKGDNFVSFPQADSETIDEFIEFLDETNEFSKEQLAALKCIYEGPVNPRTGERIYNGMPIGSERYGCGIADCQKDEPPHFYPFIWTFGKDYDAYSFDFDYDMEKVNEKLALYLNSNSTDLDKFFAHGGKFIMFSGSCDPCVPFPDAMNYYNRLERRYGGELTEKFRYFLFPGKDHGDGGFGTQSIRQSENGRSVLDALRLWCEKDVKPEFFAAVSYNGDTSVKFIRKTYPYKSENGRNQLKGKCPPSCSEYYLNK